MLTDRQITSQIFSVKKFSLVFGCVAACVLFTHFAHAQTNLEINYQGKLTDSGGAAVSDGTYNMRFWLLQSTGQATSSAAWTEERTSGNRVQVTNGLFSVMLGDVSSLAGVDFNQTLYLGVEIGGTGASPSWDGEMSPRKIIGTVPAAFEARKLGGVASSSFLRSDQADTASGLLTFTGGLLANSSSTITDLTSVTATTTNLVVNGERFTDLTGTGLENFSNSLRVATTTLGLGDGTLGGLSDVNTTNVLSGNLLSYNGSSWATTSTSTLGLGNGTFLGLTDTPNSYTANALLFASSSGSELTNAANIHTDGRVLSLSNALITENVLAVSNTGAESLPDRLGSTTAYIADNFFVSDSPGDRSGNALEVYGVYTASGSAGSVSGNLLDMQRDSRGFSSGGDVTVTGALSSFTDTCSSFSGGTCTSSADVLQLSQEVVDNTGTTLNITSASTNGGDVFRVNDDGTLTDTSPFLIDSAGDTMIGTTTSRALLTVDGDLFVGTSSIPALFVDSASNKVAIGTSTPADLAALSVFSSEIRSLEVGSDHTINTGLNITNKTFTGADYSLLVGGSGSFYSPGSFSIYNDNRDEVSLLVNQHGNVRLGESGLYNGVASSTLTVYGNASVGADYYDAIGPSNGLIVQGMVGIGTTTPAYDLTVAGDTWLNGALYDSVNNSAGVAGYVLQTTGTGTQWVATSTLGLGGGGSSTFLGLTDTPDSYTANHVLYTTASAVASSSDFTFDGTNLLLGTSSSRALLTVDGDFFVGTSSVPSLFADVSTGNVGIGTSSPNARLTVAGDINIDNRMNNLGGLFVNQLPIITASSTSQNFYFAGATSTSFTSGATSNFAFGQGVLNSLTTGDYNVGFGPQTMQNLTTGGSNFAVGYQALQGSSTAGYTGVNSIALGYRALGNASGGGANFAAGPYALYQNISGNNNMAFGSSALYNNTSGSGNMGFGNSALYNNTSGSGNMAFGGSTLYTNTTGADNIAFGQNALFDNTTGSYNSAIGWYSLNDNTSGQYNNAMGYQSLTGSDIWSHNNAFGQYALQGIDGEYNIGVGPYAGQFGTGNYNIALGHTALNNTTGTGTIAIGYRVADNSYEGDRGIFVGYDIEAQSNTDDILNIGNLIFGTGVDGTGTTLSSGNIGIGTSTPSSKLDVWGDFRVGTSSLPALFTDVSTNRVGIGTTTPAYDLTVDGDTWLGGALYDSVNNSAGVAGYVLQSTSNGTEWIATSTLGLGDGTLGGLSDTNTTNVLSGNLLSYNGSSWATTSTSTLNVALSDTTGTLAATRGGTGLSSITQNQLLIGGAGNTWSQVATSSLGLGTINSGTSGQVAFYTADGKNIAGAAPLNIVGEEGSTSWTFAGTGASDDTASGASWTLVDDIDADDGNPAQIFNNIDTEYLKGTNFGFTSSDIPTDATINGIEVRFEAYSDANQFYEIERVRLVDADGVISTIDRGDDTLVALSPTVYTYGGNNDLWGDIWNPSDLYDADFGFVTRFHHTNGSLGEAINVDYYQVRVHYTLVDGESRVAVGTTTPGAQLEVVRKSSSSYDAFNVSSSTSGDLFTVDGSGNVGISSSTPSRLLTVAGNMYTQGLEFTSATGTDLTLGTTTSRALLTVDGDLFVGTSSLPALFADVSTGRVGIGTTTPAYDLTVAGDTWLNGALYDSVNNSAGVAGYVLQSTSNGTQWVATSTLGLGGGGADTNNYGPTVIVAASNASNTARAHYVADGTDDEETIQNAINSLPASGGTVELTEGRFNVGTTTYSTSVITLDNGVRLMGQGSSTVLHLNDGSGNNIAIFEATSKSFITIKDLNLQGNQANNTANDNQNGITFDTVSSSTIDNVIANDFQDHGVSFTSSYGNRIQNSTANDNEDQGFFLQSSSNNNTLSNNTATNNSRGFYLFFNTTNNTLSNNIAQNNTYGFFLQSSSNNNTLTSNTATNNNYGFSIASSNNSTLTSNTSNTNTYGFYLQSNANSNTFTSNTTNNNNTYGFYLQSSADSNTFTSNTTNNNGSRGFAIFSSDNNTLISNSLEGNNREAIYLSFSARNTISTNNLEGNGDSGVYPSIFLDGSLSDDNLIIGNTISATGTDPLIEIDDSAQERNQIANNVYINAELDDATFVSDAGTNTRYDDYNRTTLTTPTGVGHNLLKIYGSSTVALASTTQLGTGAIEQWGNSSGDVMTLDNSGNLLLGTSTSRGLLTVDGDLFVGTSSLPALFADVSTGRVGIGTTTPAYDLTVAGDTWLNGALYDSINNSAGSNGMVLQTTGGGFQWVATSTLGIASGGSSLFTQNASTTYLTALQDRFSVGTTSAIGRLNVSNRGLEQTWSQVGSGLSVSGVGLPALTTLSLNRVAFVDATNDELRTYEFDGTSWSQVGSGLPVSGVSTPTLATLTTNRVAFIDAGNDSLRTYEFDGSTWSLIGSGLPISSVGTPTLTTLSPNRVAFYDENNNSLSTYEFDGSTWSLIGSGLSISGGGTGALTTLSPNRVAFYDNQLGNQKLRTYEFNGTTWSQVGNAITITSGNVGTLSTLSSNRVAFFDTSNESLRTYEFNGTTWSQVGTGFTINTGGYPSLTTLSPNRIAFIDAGDDQLRTYQFSRPSFYVTNDEGYPYFSVSDNGYTSAESLLVNAGAIIKSAATGTNATNGTSSPALTVEGSSYFGGDILPSTNALYDLGGQYNRFADVWAEKLTLGTTTSRGLLTVDGDFFVGTSSLATLFADVSTSRVGIGTTTPTNRLSVLETVDNPQVRVSYDGSRYATLQVDSAGDLMVAASGGNTFFNDDNVFICTGGACPGGDPTGTGNLFVENKLGLGTTTPEAPLDIWSGAGVKIAQFFEAGVDMLVGALTFDSAPASDHSASGNIVSDIAASTTVAIGDSVYLNSSGAWGLSDATASTSVSHLMGVAIEAGSNGDDIDVATGGAYVRDDSWDWTTGGTVYASTSPGVMTQTKPSSSGNVVRVIGVATSPDVIKLEYGSIIVLN